MDGNIYNLKGNSELKIDIVVDDSKELLNINNYNEKIAVIKNSLDIYYNKNNQWINIGSLKGQKGSRYYRIKRRKR